MNKVYQKLRRARLRDLGLCGDCTLPIDGDSRIRCNRCKERLVLASRRYREANHSRVVARHRELTNKIRAAYVAAGLCRDCGRPRNGVRRIGHTRRCMRCARRVALAKWRRKTAIKFGSDPRLSEMLLLKRALLVKS